MFRLSGLVLALVVGVAAAEVAHAQTLTTLASFSGSNGWYPAGGLTLSATGNTLYGTTDDGGANGVGEVFSVPVRGGGPTVLASFTNSTGRNPYAGLTLSADGATLYGTTQEAGPGVSFGTVFSVPVGGGSPTVLAAFNHNDGDDPESAVTLSGGTLLGTTYQGGANGYGTLFSVPVSGGSPTALVSFNSNSANPIAGLTLSPDGNTLYGTTYGGGAFSCGEVFSIPVSGGSPTVLASFNATDGAGPQTDLTLSANTLYGETLSGGAYGGGTIFSVPVSGGSPTVLASLPNSDVNGPLPETALTLSANGNTLYGNTTWGGAYGDGEVFSLPVSGGSPTTLASFNGSNGENPLAGPILIGNTLYGTTANGGAYGDGTVFALTLPVPEPSIFALLAVGAMSLLVPAWRRRARQQHSRVHFSRKEI